MASKLTDTCKIRPMIELGEPTSTRTRTKFLVLFIKRLSASQL